MQRDLNKVRQKDIRHIIEIIEEAECFYIIEEIEEEEQHKTILEIKKKYLIIIIQLIIMK